METKTELLTEVKEEVKECCGDCQHDNTPNLEDAPEKLDQSLEEAMMQLQQEEAYIKHQCCNELNNFLGMASQEATHEVILNVLIEAGLTTKENIAKGIQDYIVKRVEEYQQQVYKTHDELLEANPEELPDLDMRLKSVNIMKDIVDEYLQVISKPIEETLKEADKETENPKNVVPFARG